MITQFDKNLITVFADIKAFDEKILWAARPVFAPYIILGLVSGIFSILFGIIWILMSDSFAFFAGGFGKYIWLIGLFLILKGLYAFVMRIFNYSKTAYALTNKRIIIKSGSNNADFQIIDFDRISEINLYTSFVERKFNVSSIRFFSGKTTVDEGITSKVYETIVAIEAPNEVLDLINQTTKAYFNPS